MLVVDACPRSKVDIATFMYIMIDGHWVVIMLMIRIWVIQVLIIGHNIWIAQLIIHLRDNHIYTSHWHISYSKRISIIHLLIAIGILPTFPVFVQTPTVDGACTWTPYHCLWQYLYFDEDISHFTSFIIHAIGTCCQLQTCDVFPACFNRFARINRQHFSCFRVNKADGICIESKVFFTIFFYYLTISNLGISTHVSNRDSDSRRITNNHLINRKFCSLLSRYMFRDWQDIQETTSCFRSHFHPTWLITILEHHQGVLTLIVHRHGSSTLNRETPIASCFIRTEVEVNRCIIHLQPTIIMEMLHDIIVLS